MKLVQKPLEPWKIWKRPIILKKAAHIRLRGVINWLGLPANDFSEVLMRW